MGDNRLKIDQLKRYMRMIEKQSGATVRPWREDGYINVLNKYGTQRDTTEHYYYAPDPEVPDSELIQFYEQNGLFAKIIDAPAEEAVKHGFELKGSDETVDDVYKEALNKLEWEEVAITAIKYTRLFGGAIAVMLINDGGDLTDPVNWQRIESIDDIRVYDRSVIVPDYNTIYTSDMYADPFSASGSKLGYPEYYNVYSIYGSFRVHESRCLIFQNGVLSERSTNDIYRMWGVPEYMRLNRAIRDTEIAHGSSVKLLDRAIQAVYSMKGLTAELATEGGEDRVLKRLQMIDMARGLMNTITIDAEGEDYNFRQFSFTGVAEVIDNTCNYLSALTNIPQTILFGRSPAGMNATGQGDLENWYNYVERIQKRMLKNNVRYLLAIIFQAALNNGELEEPPILEVEFEPLWSLSEQEQIAVDQQKAGIAQTRAATAQMYIDMQVLDPSEVREALAKEDEFDVETMLDDYTLEELEERAPAGEEEGGGMPGGDPMAGGMPGGDPMAGGMPGMGGAPPEAPAQEQAVAQDEAEPNCVGVLIVKNGKVLCGRRNDASSYRRICGPGGHMEDGETPEDAAIRETQEEFGVTPLNLMPLGVGPEEEDGCIPMVFLCTEYDGDIQCLDKEMEDPRFVDLQVLQNLNSQLFKPFKNSLSMLMHALYAPEEKKDEKPKVIKFLDFVRKKLNKRKLTSGAENDIMQSDANRGHAGSYDKLSYDEDRGHAGSYDKLSYDEDRGHAGSYDKLNYDEKGQWVTTEKGHHVHLNEEGRPDKGNPHVVSKMGGKSKKKSKNEHKRVTWAEANKEKLADIKAKEAAKEAEKKETEKKAAEEAKKKAEDKKKREALENRAKEMAKKIPGYTVAEPLGANKFKQGFSQENLDNHWDGGINPMGKPMNSHKHEFKGMTKEEYGQYALDLIQKPVGGDILGHVNKDNQIVRFEKSTGVFVKGDPNIGIAACFKAAFPTNEGEEYNVANAMKYYMRQKNNDLKEGGIG